MSDDGSMSHRQRVRDRLGSEFEAKASDAFCASFAQSLVNPRRGRPPVVLELDSPVDFSSIEPDAAPPPPLPPAPRPPEPRMRGGRAGPGPDPESEPVIADPRVRAARERALAAMRPVLDELARNAAQGPVMRGRAAAPPPQVCWLNQTVRTRRPAAALAPVGGDPRVRHIDVARPLVRDFPPAGGVDRVVRGARRGPGPGAGPPPVRDLRASGRIVGAHQVRQALDCTGRGVIIALIDSEVAADHADLRERVIRRRNFTSEVWGRPGNHGTAVAGVIVAQGAQLGIAPDARLYNYKVLGSTTARDADDFDLACALEWALMDGVRIANVSLGTHAATDGTSREARACDAAWTLGMTIVKSAGNKGHAPSTITCPADARGVIVVGATDRDGIGVQPYSSRGPAANGKPCPDLVAPGGTDYATLDSCRADGTFGCCGYGTTLAAPHVAGLLALLLEAKPWLTPDQQRQELLARCTPLRGDVNDQGAGLVRWA